MCGILGIFAFGHSPDVPSWGLPALAPLAHRGPDAQGCWTSADRRCWFGHTRLAIQDLTHAGAQPMTSHCGRITLTFNGEIYNHHQLRQRLNFNAWRGQSDTETLVEGLAEQGAAFVAHLCGMFAFVAYDNQSQRLILVRDRLGIKPLYVFRNSQSLWFSSERRALPLRDSLNPQEVTQVLAFGHLSTATVFPGNEPNSIVYLPPGVVMVGSADGSFQTERYWPSESHSSWSPLSISSESQATTLLHDQLQQVICDHLLADVPVACFLSGGLDSGVITALASRQYPGQINTFTIALPDSPENDEASLAREMSRFCGTKHHELTLDKRCAVEWVEEGLSALDVPTADGINTFIVSKLVADSGVKVALSGLGADELFGGYPSHRFMPFLQCLRFLPSRLRSSFLRTFSRRLSQKLLEIPRWDHWHMAVALRRWASDADLRAAGVVPLQWPQLPFRRLPMLWGQVSIAELYGYTEPMLLRDSDVMSMVSGLELRVPFLDHRIVELALRMPQRFQKSNKGLLRKTFHDLFPPGYLDLPKRGFALPMALWMRGPLRRTCRDRLESLEKSRWLDSAWVDQQWQRFETGNLNWPRAWSLVVLGEFARRHACHGLVSSVPRPDSSVYDR